MSIDESGLGRWARLKKARKDRSAANKAAPADGGTEEAVSKSGRGKASPTAYPVETSGDYRPWLPPLTEGASNSSDTSGNRAAVALAADEGQPHDDDVLSAEEVAVAREMELPDINTLEEESDFSVFMRDGVPDKLRRLALRKLWASNPLFGFRDGLNDYDEDFRGLSDYVYNSVAMKRFTEPDAELETTAGESAEGESEQAAENEGQGDEESGKNGDPDAKTTEVSADAEKVPVEASDDEDLIDDEDPELG